MVMWTRMYVSIACLGLLCCCVRIAFAQDNSAYPGTLPLTVPVGAPLHIVLTKKCPSNTPVFLLRERWSRTSTCLTTW